MTKHMMQLEVVAVADKFLSVPSQFDLCEIWQEVKYGLHITDDREVKRLTLEIVREMLRRGARADFDCGAPTGVRHPETTLDEVMARIEREWAALEGLPDVGDICVFAWSNSAMEAYRK